MAKTMTAERMDLHKLLTWDQLGALDAALEHEMVQLRGFRNEVKDHWPDAEQTRAFWRKRITWITEVRQVLGLPALGPDPDEAPV